MAAGSNVQVSIDSVSSNSVTVLCSITTSGRQEYGYIVVMDMDGVELTRSDGFTVYGNSSTTKTVSGLAYGTYQASFYSDDYSELVSPYAQFTVGAQSPKIYGSAKAITDIGSLQIQQSQYSPSISAINKNTLISALNSTRNIRNRIIDGGTIDSVAYEIRYDQSANLWRPRLIASFGSTNIEVGSDYASVDDAVRYLETWGGVIITPVTGNRYSAATVSDITYGNGTKSIRKLYGSALFVSSVESFTKEDPYSWVTASDPIDDSVFLSKVNESFPGVNADREANNDYLNGRVLLYMDKNVSSSGQLTFRVSYGRGDSTSAYQIVHSVHPSDVTAIVSLAAQWGIDINASSVLSGTACRLTIICDTERRTKEIKKLYASVNGQTKLIHQV